MKKIILSILVFLLCGGAVASTFFLIDNENPKIVVNSTPTLACNVSFDDLMKYASVSDNENVKSFFIEESSLVDIAVNRYFTYVAIDESNNVAKQRVSVNVDPEVNTYHIEVLKPLQAQIKKTLKSDEYLALKNGCGWDIQDTFMVDGVDFNIADVYDAKISVKKHDNVEPVYTSLEVADFTAPRIYLKEESYKDWGNKTYSDAYFLDFIDRIEDDHDDPDELRNKIVVNWREQMVPSASGYVNRGGTFTITYRVTDSEGNTGKATLRLVLDAPTYSNSTEGGE